MHNLKALVLALASFGTLAARAEGPPRGFACAARLTPAFARPTDPTKFIVTRREPRQPGTGLRALPLARAPIRPESWTVVPVNAPFAMDTYTSLVELAELLTRPDRRAAIPAALALPAHVVAEIDWERRFTAREFTNHLGASLYRRGRRLIVFDEDGSRR